MSKQAGKRRARDARRRTQMMLIAAGLLIVASWVSAALGGELGAEHGGGLGLPGYLMAAAAVITGLRIGAEAWRGLLQRQMTIPFLVTVAAAGALVLREPWEAAAVTWLYLFGGQLENLTLMRTRAAVTDLVDLMPRTALVRRGEEMADVPAATVQAGDIVVIKPGERLPVDGTVVAGSALLDTAALTGEPLPVEATVGATVASGSVCRSGYLEVRATRVGADTTLSRLLFLISEAQEQKPRVQQTLDQFARWYTPAVIIGSVLLFIFTRDAELALTMLVISCPGALVVAAPVAIAAGLGHAARQGILIKGGERLERIGSVDTVAFDKTGTLTVGEARVSEVATFGGIAPQALTALAAGAEQRSEHHLAAAILNYARDTGTTPGESGDWRLLAGLGVAATVDGRAVLVGNRRLLAAEGVTLSADQDELIRARERDGATVALIAVDGAAAGLIAITDQLRPGAERVVPALKQAGVTRVIMLSGDNQATAAAIGRRVGVDEARGSLLPEDKLTAVRDLQSGGRVVAMVGDGVNDAPALASADISVAMGVGGTDAAFEAADIALMSDRIELVPHAIALSRRIVAVVRQNVAFAVIVVAGLLAAVLTKRVALAGGMFVHEASILVVIVNGMRLLGGRRPD
ncbi:MAG: heavy metal translocating P-type ATPase [Chloroflexota bacterium]